MCRRVADLTNSNSNLKEELAQEVVKNEQNGKKINELMKNVEEMVL
jgi:hypothetical protein